MSSLEDAARDEIDVDRTVAAVARAIAADAHAV
jgi:hypothetical protein